METRSLCTLVFGVVRPLSPLPSKRNSGFGCVHTRTHTDDDCVHARVSRAPPRYLADLSVPWAALRGRERDKGEGGGGERVREGIGNGAEVMSIIGFNIGALGKPVYKYPYGTVITT